MCTHYLEDSLPLTLRANTGRGPNTRPNWEGMRGGGGVGSHGWGTRRSREKRWVHQPGDPGQVTHPLPPPPRQDISQHRTGHDPPPTPHPSDRQTPVKIFPRTTYVVGNKDLMFDSLTWLQIRLLYARK